MDFVKSAAKTITLLIGFFLIWAVAFAITPIAGLVLSIAGVLTAVFTAYNPVSKIWISTRKVAVSLGALSFLAAATSYQMIGDQSLAQLKQSDPAAYLAAIKSSKPDSVYLAELEAMHPDEFKRESDRRAERARQAATEKAERTIAEAKERSEREKLAAEQRAVKAKAEAMERARRHPAQQIELSKLSWRKDGFGTVMTLSFTATNKNSFDVKDLTIKCTHSAPSGTEIDSNTSTLYEVIKSGASRSFRNFNMGFIHSQSARTSCEVTRAVAL